MKSRRNTKIVVLGMAGRAPFAGVAWQVLHYLEGFRRLGYDVYYVEDTGAWPYDPEQQTITDDCSYTVSYIARLMSWAGFADRWAYCAAPLEGKSFGLSDARLACLLQQADVLINLTGATVLREEHLRVPVRIYLETDPVLPQVEVAEGRSFTVNLLSAHTHHFSYGENFGAPDCGVPVTGFEYLPTRQPVVLDWWKQGEGAAAAADRCFTTVASWQQAGKDLEWNGERYSWSKHLEFLKFIELPRLAGQRFELALAAANARATEFQEAVAHLSAHGWRVVDGLALSTDILPYRKYIQHSYGEFTVAKDQNIRLRSGWFSDRSATYLAAGRPVITQDTAFGNVLPTGRGLFAFRTMDDVLSAIDAMDSDPEVHARAALEIACEYFAAEKVVGDLMQRAGI